jgi:hypothetical protein
MPTEISTGCPPKFRQGARRNFDRARRNFDREPAEFSTGQHASKHSHCSLDAKKLMPRSHSGQGFDAEQKKKGRRLMERSSSVPVNMHSNIDVRRWESLSTHATNMQGHCVIKNSRSAPSELHVLMTAKDGKLCIYFEQLQEGIWRKFRLLDLFIEKLVLMYSMRDADSFYIATPWQGSLDVSIYCTPAAQSTNSWLLTLTTAHGCTHGGFQRKVLC